ncbi:hypothetical protein [uncultured Fusobacterium sp.]|uniref:hypothetical protein n=1 Tax=uncultured Fusobacterium sp. TaxID=159267 RepID=UPI0025FE01AF|nr:hypothetical protein [uncultured Fusobacterium sp.]
MSELEKKVERYRENLLRMLELKKGLIDAEISLVSLKLSLNLSAYEWKKLVNGQLEEREGEVWELIKNTPVHIKNRDKIYKHFQKTLLEKDIKISEIAEALDIDINKIIRIVKRLNINRDIETEKKIENFLGVKVFE